LIRRKGKGTVFYIIRREREGGTQKRGCFIDHNKQQEASSLFDREGFFIF